jgi:hypothetical protein
MWTWHGNSCTMHCPTVSPPSRGSSPHPAIGFPTCYTLQADGIWAREELADVDTGWVVVGTMTYGEMKAAVDESNASAS